MRTPPWILIVDDNPTNVSILQARLGVHGYHILTAADGEEALAAAFTHRPDLILLDVMMPKMDGIEVCRRLKSDQALASIPIIMVTAKGEPRDVVAGIEAGCDEYLTKPVDQTALVARVKSMLRIKALHDTVQEQAALLAEQNQSLEARVAEHLAEQRLAARIQTDLLPKAVPVLAGYDFAGKTIPARLVGGDYFDFIPVDETRLAICVGDVSGKGLPASLLMANLQATIRGQTLVQASPEECLRRSNTLLFRCTGADCFVTFFYGILDTREHRFLYSNAGHNPPLLLSGALPPQRLEAGGLVLGVLEDHGYEQETVPLRPGDLLVLYSDGITEAATPEGEQFGDERLLQLIRDYRNETSSALLERILHAVDRYALHCLQSDDRTVVVLKRL